MAAPNGEERRGPTTRRVDEPDVSNGQVVLLYLMGCIPSLLFGADGVSSWVDVVVVDL